MLFFKYLTNMLQHSSLNGCFYENFEYKTAHIFTFIFASFYCSYGEISMKEL